MEISLNTTEISKAIDQFKNTAANSLFDQVTGNIKGALENSGVEIKSNTVPIAKQESQGSSVAINWAPYVLGGVAVVAFFLLKKKSGLGRV